MDGFGRDIMEEKMEAILVGLMGKKIDVNCSANVMYRGDVETVSGGILTITNEDGQAVFISIDKIAAITECRDPTSRPGFIV